MAHKEFPKEVFSIMEYLVYFITTAFVLNGLKIEPQTF